VKFLNRILLLACLLAPLPAPAAKPNVILIITDDQGYGDMSCHGNPILKTPNLDKLHSESVRLTDFHVDPMCAPTRAALMTGRYSARAGVWSTLTGCYIPPRSEVTLGHIFSDAGYKTAMFGKWHLGDTYPYGAEHRGFQHVVRHGAGVIGEVPDYWNNDYFDDTYLENGKWRKFDGFCTDIWFDETIDYIRSCNAPSTGSGQAKPFFCYLATNAPHGPHNVHERYVRPYLDAGVPKQRADFYGLIANIDENIGRLTNFLDQENLAENTILIFMGDNGTAGGVSRGKDGTCKPPSPINGFNAGMRGTKTWPYDGGHRNACFIRWPKGGVGGGRDVPGLSAHFDLMPTLAELCGLKLPDIKLDGISLVEQLTGKKAACPDRTLVVQNMQLVEPKKYKDFAVMTNQWRLVKTRIWPQPKPQLFDIAADPGQANDVAAKHPEVVKTLMAAYENWWKEMLPSYSHVSRLVVGSGQENPVLLTCHSWRTPSKEMSYNQRHVRDGVMIDDAYWPIEVERDGRYRIELRRWPREADASLGDSVPKVEQPFVKTLPEGRAFEIIEAWLKVGDYDNAIPVKPAAKAAVFEVELKKGNTRLQTRFKTHSGESIGAYYVYVERMVP